MKPHLRMYVVWLTSFLLLSYFTNAQSISTEGRDFWTGFMENDGNFNNLNMEVYISAKDSVNGKVEIPLAGWVQEFSVSANSTQQITIPTNLVMAIGSENIERKGVHITTDNDVSVFVLNNREFSADASVVLPTVSLGKEYMVMSFKDQGSGGPSTEPLFMIIGVEDSTEIEIIPTATTWRGKAANEPFRIILDSGEVYQVKSVNDLTGTKISAVNTTTGDCKNFAVLAGHEWTRIGNCGGAQDHLLEQMYPINTWGKGFVIVPFATRSFDIYRVLALEDSTEVSTPQGVRMLQSGEHFQNRLNSTISISSNKPISVAQYSTSQSCDSSLGDPFMIMISPNEQQLQNITFNALEVQVIENYFINVVAKTDGVSLLRLDGELIGNEFSQVPNLPEYSFAQKLISKGNHTITSDSGFIAYVYGYGNIESFGYATGVSLENLQLEILSYDESFNPDIDIDSVCLGSEMTFTADGDNLFNFFDWNFGGEALLTGDTVSYTFNRAGRIPVIVTAKTNLGDCANEESAVKFIQVMEPKVEITGPRSVCPNVTQVDYFIENGRGDYSYEWSVSGGTIAGGNGNDSIKVNWGESNFEANVSVIATSSYGCVGSPTKAPVRINIQLEPAAPIGADSLCSSDIFEIPYKAVFTNGSTYTWFAENGEIVAGDGSNEVLVNWNAPGIGKLWYEETNDVDIFCAGISDTLQVFIEREPDLEMAISANPNPVTLQAPVQFSVDADPNFQLASWDFGDGTTLDSVDIDVPVSHIYECEGNYQVKVKGFTTTLCEQIGEGETIVTTETPNIFIQSVSHDLFADSTLILSWKFDGSTNYSDNFLIFRREIEPQTLDWEQVESLPSGSSRFTDSTLDTDGKVYEYKIETNESCPTIVGTEPHNSIRVTASIDEENESTLLSWNTYQRWQGGVQKYEIWRSVDGSTYEKLEETTNTIQEFPYEQDGFEFCYRIKAIEAGGENEAWSNTTCTLFIPQLDVYNAVTPNQDNLNETFTIDRIQLYPKSKLSVYNRFGEEIYSKIGYQNDWNGEFNGEKLPSGTYFYHLEVNEERSDVKELKGFLQIIY